MEYLFTHLFIVEFILLMNQWTNIEESDNRSSKAEYLTKREKTLTKDFSTLRSLFFVS